MRTTTLISTLAIHLKNKSNTEIRETLENYNKDAPIPDLIDVQLLNIKDISEIDLILKLISSGAKPEMFAEKNNLLRLLNDNKLKVDKYFDLLTTRLYGIDNIDQLPPTFSVNIKPYKKMMLKAIMDWPYKDGYAALEKISNQPDSTLGKVFREGHTDRSRGTFGAACNRYIQYVNMPANEAKHKVSEKIKQTYKNSADFDWANTIALIEKHRIHPSELIYEDPYQITVMVGGRSNMVGSRQTYRPRSETRYRQIGLRSMYDCSQTKPTLEQIKKIYRYGLNVVDLLAASENELYDHILFALEVGARSYENFPILDKLTSDINNNTTKKTELLSYLPRIMHYEVAFSRSPKIGFEVITEWLFRTATPEQITPEMLINLKPHKPALFNAIKNMSIDDDKEALRQIKQEPNSVLGKVFRVGHTDESRGTFGKACAEYDKRTNPPAPSFSSSILSFFGFDSGEAPIPNSNIDLNENISKEPEKSDLMVNKRS